MRRVIQFIRSNRGATAIEYGLICALIAVAIMASLSSIANGMGQTFGVIGNAYNK